MYFSVRVVCEWFAFFEDAHTSFLGEMHTKGVHIWEMRTSQGIGDISFSSPPHGPTLHGGSSRHIWAARGWSSTSSVGSLWSIRHSELWWIAGLSRSADRRTDWFPLRVAATGRGHCFVDAFNTPAEPSCLLRRSCFVFPFSRGWDRAGVSPAIAPTKPRTPSRLLTSNPGSWPFQSVSSGEETLTLGPLRA